MRGRPGAISYPCTADGEATAAHGTVCYQSASLIPSPGLLWGLCVGGVFLFFFFFKKNLFSLITVFTSQRDTVWECRRTESLKQNKLKYGTFFFFSSFWHSEGRNQTILVQSQPNVSSVI